MADVQARNKPTETPKKPEAAPFFLPAAPGLASDPAATIPALLNGVADAAPLRMSNADGSAVEAEQSDEGAPRDGAATVMASGQVLKATAATAKLWETLPLFAKLKEGDASGKYTGAATWLAAASAVAVERQVLCIASEAPFEAVRPLSPLSPRSLCALRCACALQATHAVCMGHVRTRAPSLLVGRWLA